MKEILKNIYKTNNPSKMTRSDLCRIRCQFCGDSKSNLNDMHMYISYVSEPLEALLFYCQKCNKGGRITNKNINKFTNDQNTINTVKDMIHYGLFKQYIELKSIPLGLLPRDDNRYLYLVKRIGRDISDDELSKMRIISNTNNFCNQANVPNKINDKYNISFCSTNYGMILSRDINKSDNGWVKYPLKQGISGTIYNLKNSIDLLNNDPMTIHISEGIFDILSIYCNLPKQNNDIHIAALGKNYEIPIRWLLSKGIVGKNINILIYSDSDVKLNKIALDINKYTWIFNKIEVVYNLSSDDFGVPLNRILLSNRTNILEYKEYEKKSNKQN